MFTVFRTTVNFLHHVVQSFMNQVFRRPLNQALKITEKIKPVSCLMALSTVVTERRNSKHSRCQGSGHKGWCWRRRRRAAPEPRQSQLTAPRRCSLTAALASTLCCQVIKQVRFEKKSSNIQNINMSYLASGDLHAKFVQ